MGVRMHADPKRVQQVVRNLLENARKYGGDQVLVEGFAHGEQYVLVVSDNGPGVPDGSANQIFEHFEQLSKGDSRSSSGIGLGLPIARRLARAMGGDVWYERRFPTGSRFCFSLPVKALVTDEPPSGMMAHPDTAISRQ
jgi:signal transduction histidine kinase